MARLAQGPPSRPALSQWLRSFWWAVAGAGLGVALALRMWTAPAAGRLQADRIVLEVPVLGPIALLTAVARFARITGALLRSGVPMLAALAVVKDMMGNQVLARAVGSLGEGVRRGVGLSKPMADTGVFPPWPFTWSGSARRQGASTRCCSR